MIIRKKRITGMLLLALSATAFTVSSVVLIATWFSGLPAWVMLPTLTGAASGITGARLVTATKSTGLGISISLLCVAALLCVALIALKTEMFGDPNIGAGFIALIGVVLQPAGAVISLTTLVTMLVRSRNSIVSGA